jgi:hypothetical protein
MRAHRSSFFSNATRAGLSLLLVLMTCAASTAQVARAGDPKVFAFVGVNVVPLDRERVVDNQTVVVRDGRITQITPSAQTNVTAGVGLGGALVARQSSIEHLDRYIASTVADQFAAQVPPGQLFFGEFLRHIDDDKLRVVARDTRDAGVANTPTLGLFSLISSNEQVGALLQLPEMRYVSAGTRNAFAQQRQGTLSAIATNGLTQADLEAFVAARAKITRGLREAGAVLLAGSDSPQYLLVSGFALHRELRALAAAGLTPYEALVTATRAPAEYLRAVDSVGTVQVGKRADLLLLDANPLLDVSAAARPAGLVLRGRWLPQSELQNMLGFVASIHGQTSSAKGESSAGHALHAHACHFTLRTTMVKSSCCGVPAHHSSRRRTTLAQISSAVRFERVSTQSRRRRSPNSSPRASRASTTPSV